MANTSIKEGSKARSFGPVAALMVQGDDGKYLPWVPESERQLGTKSVNKNGIYQAKKDGVYGWRSVSVNVPTDQGVTGTDPTTGQQVAVGVGPTGELTETVVPVEIRVITPPSKTTYQNGDVIDYSGIVVHAFDAKGNDLGAVPFNELVFPTTTVGVDINDTWTDDAGLNAKAIYITPHYWEDGYGEHVVYVHTPALGSHMGYPATYGNYDTPATVLITRYENGNYGLCIGPGSVPMYLFTYSNGVWRLWGSSSASAQNDRFSRISFGDVLSNFPVSTVDPTGVDPSKLHGEHSIPVLWARTGDREILETHFEIVVNGN